MLTEHETLRRVSYLGFLSLHILRNKQNIKVLKYNVKLLKNIKIK
jgi:hypothetical protein